MLDSWEQPSVGGRRDRLSSAMHGWLARVGSVTNLLLIITIAVFLVQLAFAAAHSFLLSDLLALNARRFLHGFVWQPVTYMFLHDAGDPWHIIFNMLGLWFFGREIEHFIGQKYFTRLYLLGGVAGAALWFAFSFSAPSSVLLGASAAVLACVIAFATLFPNREVLLFFIPIPAKILALIIVALDLVPVMTGAGSKVAHLAHLGGAAFGYLYIKNLGYGQTPAWMEWLQKLGRSLRPRQKPRPRDLSPDEYMRESVDPILDKISREGMQSLTRRERKILESAKEQIGKSKR